MREQSHPHKRKRIVLRLTPEQATDPQSILDATRAALREQIAAPVETASLPVESPAPAEPVKRSSLAHLQRAAFDHAAAVLREKSELATATETPPRFDGKAWWLRREAVGAFVARNAAYVVAVWERATR